MPAASLEPASPRVRCREFASSSSATSWRPINTLLRRGERRGARGTRTLHQPSPTPSSVHCNQIVAISPHFHRAPPHTLLFSLFFFFSTFPPSLPSSLRVSCPATATRIRLLGSVRLCVRYPILPSPGPDPLCLASLPEPPSSSLPVLRLPWPASSPPDAPLLFAAGACEEERAAGGRGVLETVRCGTGLHEKSVLRDL